jgi:aarF domain-containing kinase
VAGYALSDKERRGAIVRTARGLQRLTRVVSFGVVATLRDVHFKALSLPENSPEHAAKQEEMHQKNARDFLRLCLANGAGYLKMAQYLSTQSFLPKAWTSTLAMAQDHAEPVTWAAVSNVFLADTGLRPEEVFESIEEAPCAAASIAQVHRAVTRDGRRVAVKIQYPHMHETFAQDLAALRLMLSFIEWYWPDYGYSWVLPEFAKQSLCEIDFLQVSC